jgi:ABC-type transport system involved in multi-copper enzyme maturation permease subunit
MSTAIATPDTTRLGDDLPGRPSLARLTAVELRKMTDTRAGFWLLVSVIAITVVSVVIRSVTGNPNDHTFRHILEIAVQPASILLPIVGILLVSSEWSQRTGLITFTLTPDRARVLGVKLAAGIVLSLAATAVCVIIAALATAIAAPGVAHTWSLPLGLLGQMTIYVMAAMIMGVGFGALFLASAPAIVLSFVIPAAWSALGSIKALEGPANWLDQSRSLAHAVEHVMSATEWAQVGTTAALWLVLPLLLGVWRITRSEIS